TGERVEDRCLFFTRKRIDVVVALKNVLTFVSPAIQGIRLDYAVVDRILKSGAQDRLDVRQTLVAGRDIGQPVANSGALELRKERLAKRRNDGVIDDLAVVVPRRALQVRFHTREPAIEILGEPDRFAWSIDKKEASGRIGEGCRVVERVAFDRVEDRSAVARCALQVSGGGLEPDPLTTADATIGEGDFDRAVADGADARPSSAHRL